MAASTPSRARNARRGGVALRAIAADADAHALRAVHRFSAQTHVGGNAVEIERAAAIDRDRDFGAKVLRPSDTPCERKAQIGGERAGIDDVFRVEAGQRD